MEDNRKFATFFADAPKGKKIGAVLSWIATVILLVALFVPGYQLRYQMKTEKGTFKDIPAKAVIWRSLNRQRKIFFSTVQ